jgi:sterol desaturase/sphingolipid hydroxylase (fatty acid hydroxylase superfamily)
MNMYRPRPMRAVFPLVLAGAPAATALLHWRFGLAPAAAMTAVVLFVIAVLWALERKWPYRSDWGARGAAETRTDLAYIALASVPDRATRVAVEAALLWALSPWGLGPRAEEGLPSLFARGATAFLLADLGKYWVHRLSHERPWLWRFHLAHHQPERLDALNALRLHPVNIAYNAAIDAMAMALLQVSAPVAAVFATLRAVVGVVQHANLDLDGQRQWLFNAPSYHRGHHSVELREANSNYASTLLLWDKLFSTLSRAPCPVRVGVAPVDHRLLEGLLGQWLYPLCGASLETTCVFARLRSLLR